MQSQSARDPSNTAASTDFDAIVIGGGPAGSTAATIIAQDGWKVLLLEREFFPRHRVGESLLPATVHGVCKVLGVDEEIKSAGFMKKMGGTFRWGSNPEPWEFQFSEQVAVKGADHAFQVERSRFDEILLRNAQKRGATVREGAKVTELLRHEGRFSGVRWTDSTGAEHVTRAKFVLDGSGARGLGAEAVGRRIYDDFFKNIAIYGYIAGGRRLPAPSSGNIFTVAFPRGWGWYIPLREDLTSVGFVLPIGETEAVRGDPAAAWRQLVDECEVIKGLVAETPMSDEPSYDVVRIVRDYSYNNERFYRDGCALIGDAACFIDPVFSSGVHLATFSGLCAARSVNSVLAGELPEQVVFAEFERRYRQEFNVFYRFLVSFYDMHEDADSYFWSARKILSLETSDREAFVRLVAGLSGSADDSIHMDTFLSKAKESSEVLEALTYSGKNWRRANPELAERAQPMVSELFESRAELLGAQSPSTSTARLTPSPNSRRWRPVESGVPARAGS